MGKQAHPFLSFVEHLEVEDDVALLIRTHLYLERALTQLITSNVARPNKLNLDDMRFASKLRLAAALDVVHDLEPALRLINAWRNEAAHHLTFVLDETKVNRLIQSLPRDVVFRVERMREWDPANPRAAFQLLIPFLLGMLGKDAMAIFRPHGPQPPASA